MASLLAFLKSKLIPDEKEEVEEIQEDLTKRLVHYNAIKKLSREIFELPQEGEDFFNIKIKNEFVISNRIVPKISLQDLILNILRYLKKKSIKMLAEENDLFNLEDGVKWLKEIYKIKEKYWLSLFNYLPKNILNERKKDQQLYRCSKLH